ncbi:MAG TPA: TadE/TadG family type IV pilus assembly protein [Streptosporangiaceae bacterium]|jgi:Flp pilus assembly protein TadG
MAVEFVLMVPLLLLLLIFLLMAGRFIEAHGEVDGAARDAARAASIARSPQAAQAAANAAVAADIHGWCPDPTVTGFVPGSTAVTIHLDCGLDLGFIDLGTVPVQGFAVAPLDPFVARQF